MELRPSEGEKQLSIAATISLLREAAFSVKGAERNDSAHRFIVSYITQLRVRTFFAQYALYSGANILHTKRLQSSDQEKSRDKEEFHIPLLLYLWLC